MSHFDLYVELNPAGTCLVHVPVLPGCLVRAANQETALALLPQHIARQTGLDPAGMTFTIVETVVGSGPLNPGDMAALFSCDLPPLTQEALADYFRPAEQARHDLLTLTQPLSDELLDWQSPKQGMTIRAILRHIGEAEQWYLSRLVDPMTLPPEWDDDQDMPVFEFLAMERQTFLARFSQLTPEALGQVYYPTAWSEKPHEGWTARKVLRRLLEHQAEHLAHIQEVLAQWRQHYLLHLAEARFVLLEQLIGLHEEMLTIPLFDTYSAKELMAHVAAWDELFAERIALVCSGRDEEMKAVELDEHNDQLHRHHQNWSIDQAITALLEQRNRFLKQLAVVGDDLLHRPVQLPWGEITTIRSWAFRRIRHDRLHAADLRQWREQNQLILTNGPQRLLIAALQASRDELEALAALLDDQELTTLPLIDNWPFRNVLGHIADWEAYCLDCLRSGRVLDRAYEGDIQLWNEAHNLTRQRQSWAAVLADAHRIRQEWLELLAAMSPSQLTAPLPNPWGRDSTPYGWSLSFLEHEREHVAEIRLALKNLITDGV